MCKEYKLTFRIVIGMKLLNFLLISEENLIIQLSYETHTFSSPVKGGVVKGNKTNYDTIFQNE